VVVLKQVSADQRAAEDELGLLGRAEAAEAVETAVEFVLPMPGRSPCQAHTHARAQEGAGAAALVQGTRSAPATFGGAGLAVLGQVDSARTAQRTPYAAARVRQWQAALARGLRDAAREAKRHHGAAEGERTARVAADEDEDEDEAALEVRCSRRSCRCATQRQRERTLMHHSRGRTRPFGSRKSSLTIEMLRETSSTFGISGRGRAAPHPRRPLQTTHTCARGALTLPSECVPPLRWVDGPEVGVYLIYTTLLAGAGGGGGAAARGG
jgi:hypothetical protein